MGVGIDTGISVIHVNRLTLSNLQRLHSCLIDATNHLNSYYSLQLFCWIACLLVDIISYIFGVLHKRDNVLLTYVQCFMLLYFSLQIIAISRICHLTCDQVCILCIFMYYVFFLTSEMTVLIPHKIFQANALAGTLFLAKTPALKHTEFSTVSNKINIVQSKLSISICITFLNSSLPFSIKLIICTHFIIKRI